jgi:hypothetical protein
MDREGKEIKEFKEFGKFKVGGYLSLNSLTSLTSLISFLGSYFATLLINPPFLSLLPTLHYCIEADLE